MGYELKEEDIYGLASSLSVQTKIKGRELFFKRCPYCDGGGHDNDTFSINLDNGLFKCFRASCGRQGHFVELARDFKYPLEFKSGQAKTYRTIPQIKFPVREPALKYLMSRGISAEVGKRYSITTASHNANRMVFPFYNENNILTFVKYRNLNWQKGVSFPKEYPEKDTRQILFGMAQCEDKTRLVVTEGQLDSLSLAEAGIKNSVSVPMGCNGFSWVNDCYDWVCEFEEIIIFGDCEKEKITLVDGFLKRFGHKKLKVVRREDYLGEKDANDILRKYGKNALITCVENAQEVMSNHVKQLADVKAVNLEAQEHILTKIHSIDKIINGLYMGTVTVLTGRRGEGKSTLASQIVTNALDQTDPQGIPYSVFIYSGELPDYHFKRWLDLQIAGDTNIVEAENSYGDKEYSLTDETVDSINAWYRDRAYIYDNASAMERELNDNESLLETIENEVRRHNIKLILIDNLMTAVDVDPSQDLYRAQSKFVQNVKLLAMKYNIAVLLIAHPRKIGNDSKITNDSISGSGDITNRVDTVLTYARSENDPKVGVISVIKNRLTGRLAEDCKVGYDPKSKRIYTNKAEHDRILGCFVKEAEIDELPPF